MLELFDADALMGLDSGVVREALNFHIRRIAIDCADRPSDDKDRSITMKIKFKPLSDQRGPRDEAAVQVTFSSSVPDHRSATLSLGVRKDGKLVYNPDSIRNVSQGTFLPGGTDEDDDA